MSIVRLGAFETIREVGAGGMGTVWQARHVASDTLVAIKFLTAERAQNPRWLGAFHAEARAISRLAHLRVVRIFDIGTIPQHSTLVGLPAGSPYIVMEWIPHSLGGVPTPLSWDATRAILLEVLDALAHVHARGIVHRDIKPSNILGRLGRLRVADFGIARLDDENPDETISGVSGTPHYMAPEQFTRTAGSVGAWTDIYAVGCLAHLLLTGEPPFAGSSLVSIAAQHLQVEFPTERLSDAMAEWMRRATAKNPAARFRFASEAAQALAFIEAPFADPSTAPTEHFISPAARTIPLTTLLLSDPELFRARPSGEHARQGGTPAPVPPWRASEEVRSHVEHISGSGLAISTMRTPPFSGREDERDALWETFRAGASTGRPTATLITGPSGSGKSRLARWLAERTHELGLAPHVGPVSVRASDEPFARLVLDELGIDDVGDRELIEERVDQRLAGTGFSVTERNAVVHLLCGTLAASAPRERLDAIRAALSVCAGGRPLLVLLDDVEEQPGEVLEVVYHTLTSGEPVHFVMTSARRMPDPLQKISNVDLPPLEEAYMSRILRDLAGLHQDLAAQVVGVARGNPGHAIRLVRGMVEKGQLRGGPHGFELLSHIELQLCASENIWTERLEQLFRELGPTTRGALEVAAVLGDEVVDAEWRAVCAAANVFIPPRLADVLDERGFALETSRGWTFADPALLRELVAVSRERNTYKTHIAAARGALPDAELSRRAAWDLEAGRATAAAKSFIEAAWAAERVCEYSRATRCLVRAEEALARVDPSNAARLATEVDVIKASVWGIERLDDADDLAARAEAAARANGWTDLLGHALARRAHFARKRVSLQRAQDLYLEARDAFAAIGSHEGVATAMQGLGMVAVARGFLPEAEELYTAALESFLEVRGLRGAAWCANGLGDVYRKLGNATLARSWYERALHWFEQIGNAYGAMWCVHDLALTRRAQGDLIGAADGLAETLRMSRRLGQRLVAPRLNLGIVHVLNGDESLARVCFEEVLEESVLRQGRGEEAMARACLLPCDAADHRWFEVSENLKLAVVGLREIVDADIGLMARVAAEHADRAGEQEIAAALRAFAATQSAG